jgi:hypothetical protein
MPEKLRHRRRDTADRSPGASFAHTGGGFMRPPFATGFGGEDYQCCAGTPYPAQSPQDNQKSSGSAPMTRTRGASPSWFPGKMTSVSV